MVLEIFGCFPHVCGEIVHLVDLAHFDDFVISLLAIGARLAVSIASSRKRT
jgi:hypothetical protein